MEATILSFKLLMEATILSLELLMEATICLPGYWWKPQFCLPSYWWKPLTSNFSHQTCQPTNLLSPPSDWSCKRRLGAVHILSANFGIFQTPPLPRPPHRQSVWACHEASILEFWSLEKAWMWNGSMAVQWDWYNREPTNARWNHCPPSLSHPAMKEKNGSSVGCLPTRPVQSVGSWGGPIQNQIIKEIKTNDLLLEQLNLSCEEERPVWYILIPQ